MYIVVVYVVRLLVHGFRKQESQLEKVLKLIENPTSGGSTK